VPAASWPVRSGALPPLADRFSTRPETAPDLGVALGRSVAVALTPRSPTAGMPEDMLRCCGKTQLAAYFAESQWHAHSIDLLLWIDASSMTSVLSGYVEAASVLIGRRLPADAGSIAASLLTWLRQTDRRWLVVLDDLVHADALSGLWPQGPGGRVVVTTANAGALAAQPDVLKVEVGPYSRREAMSYLVGRLSSDPDQRRGAIDLIEELGCHPLALAQATAAIGSSWLTCVEYREKFAGKSAQLGYQRDAHIPPHRVTWWLSLDHADQLRPGGAVQACLAYAALLDPHGVPATIFTTPAGSSYIAGERVPAGQAAEQTSLAMQALEKAGLLSVDRSAEPPIVRMDQVLQQSVRAATPQEMRDQAALAAAAALLELWTEGGGQGPHAASLLASAEALRHSTAGLLWANRCHPLLFRAGQGLDEALLTGPAVEYWSELTSVSDRLYGPGHPDSMALVERLASAYMAAGRANEAVAWYQRIMSDWAGAFGPDHSRTLAARVNLGRVLVTAGLPQDAIGVLGSALSDSERAQGTDHLETQSIRDELATAYAAAGQLPEAIRLYRRTLGDRERKAGPQDPGTISTRFKLAEAYQAAGRVKDAISQFKRAVADRERKLGADHPDTMHARASLAGVYYQAGRMAIAVQMYEQVHAGSVRVLGADHPDTLAVSAKLAGTYYAVGRLTDAAQTYRDALARAEQVLPPGDPLIRSARDGLAAIAGE
jgi:tetratricopeptide (TPR) repeat protein